MNKIKDIKIRKFLNSGVFNERFFCVGDVIDLIKDKENVTLLYGETYDDHGHTIDSIKYYLIISILHKIIESMGIEVRSFMIIGDIASIRNKNVDDKEKIINISKQRCEFVRSFAKSYVLGFEVVLMSKILKSKSFRNNYEIVRKNIDEDSSIRKLFRKTVMENRLKQEERAGFKYTSEEVSLIMNYDIKVGPPREIYYDRASQKITGGRPFGIYVQPTFPLGQDFDFYINNPEIEKYGVTPYKAGSNKLQDYRVIIGNTSFDMLRRLLEKTFVPEEPSLPNPLLDLFIIGDLFRRVQDNDYEFEQNYIDMRITRDDVSNIIQPLLKL